MQNESLEKTYVPGLGSSVAFDRSKDFLGRGTVGEVFCVRTLQRGNELNDPKRYALKIFLDHGERPHFRRECEVLEALALVPHRNIVLFLHYWTADSFQYILFPLATGDLYTFLRRSDPQPQLSEQYVQWVVRQLQGLCDALKYIHNHTMPRLSSDEGLTMGRIGFHHDIKPVNILLFEGDDPAGPIWKLSDFGSGLVSEFKDSDHESIYNSKPSTGDPIYTAPEFALEGRVSRPKDVWSLGCIYLEVLLWMSHPTRTTLDDFQQERFNLPGSQTARKPMCWYQDYDGVVYIHPVVDARMESLRDFCEANGPLEDTRLLVSRMLVVSSKTRATAKEITSGFDIILGACAEI
ncbi:kinase-like protein [Nemania sp. NC0429]|nr:kinase-like protein [Nemania sp. NC0429]